MARSLFFAALSCFLVTIPSWSYGSVLVPGGPVSVVLRLDAPADSVGPDETFVTPLTISAENGSPREIDLHLKFDAALLQFRGAVFDAEGMVCPECQADAIDSAQGVVRIEGLPGEESGVWDGPQPLTELQWCLHPTASAQPRLSTELALSAVKIVARNGRPVEGFALSRRVLLKGWIPPEEREEEKPAPAMWVGPNPFRTSTTFSYELPQPAEVKLDIYDLTGRLLRQLGGEDVARGRQHMTWDGRDDAGTPVAAGVYGFRLGIGLRTYASKLTVIR